MLPIIEQSKDIAAPGIYRMSAEDYHRDPCVEPSLSCSFAKTLIDFSPEHAFLTHPKLNPAAVSVEKDEFDFGSAAHSLFLEGVDRMAVLDFDSYRTNDSKAARTAARMAGKHPVLIGKAPGLRTMVTLARTAFERCADFGYAFDEGLPELCIIWKDRAGVWCRARPDWLSLDSVAMLDYKTTTDASPAYFSKQISRMNYHIQASFYSRGLSALTERESKFVFLAQEIPAPHGCTFHGCAPSLQQIADDKVETAIVRFAQGLQSGIWPGYPNRIFWAEAAAWQINEHVPEEREEIAFDPAKMWDKNQ